MVMDERVQESGVDLPELLARVEFDRELLREVFDIFLEEFPRLRGELRHAIDHDDLRTVQESAHTLKGMLASLSFGKASSSALQIERMAAQGVSAGMAEEFARLERSTAIAQASLASICREVIR